MFKFNPSKKKEQKSCCIFFCRISAAFLHIFHFFVTKIVHKFYRKMESRISALFNLERNCFFNLVLLIQRENIAGYFFAKKNESFRVFILICRKYYLKILIEQIIINNEGLLIMELVVRIILELKMELMKLFEIQGINRE